MRLGSNKALFTNTGSDLDLDCGCNLPTPDYKEGDANILSRSDSQELFILFPFQWTALTQGQKSMDDSFPL